MNGAPISPNGCLSAADGSYSCGARPRTAAAAAVAGKREGFYAPPPRPQLPVQMEAFYGGSDLATQVLKTIPTFGPR